MIFNSQVAKTILAKRLGVSRQSLYYRQKKPSQDWQLKCLIEKVLRQHPSYGHRRLALELRLNKKRVRRIMKLFGIKTYRRRSKKWLKKKKIKVIYPNLLITNHPSYPHHIWVSDFTYLYFQDKVVYVSTVIDLFTRQVVGLSVMTAHSTGLVLSALMNALYANPRPKIFHSDNGSEYSSQIFINALNTIGTLVSRSAPGCPWENGYQESFYSQFKIDLGDPNCFNSLGELIFNIYQTIWHYNHTRIHSALKMPPEKFAVLIKKEYALANKISV